MSFYAWLLTQQDRADAVGGYARRAARDGRHPRSSRLHVLLKYATPSVRDSLKCAHREWRIIRRADGLP